jgi:hypothetical protein
VWVAVQYKSFGMERGRQQLLFRPFPGTEKDQVVFPEAAHLPKSRAALLSPDNLIMLAFALIATPALQLSARAPGVGVFQAISMSASSHACRREVLQTGAAAVLAACSLPAFAEETFNRMAGVLEPYTDVQKGYKLYKPVAWNQVRTFGAGCPLRSSTHPRVWGAAC